MVFAPRKLTLWESSLLRKGKCMCVDFVEAKTGTRSLVSLAKEMDIFGGKYLGSQQHVVRSSGYKVKN
jgi:hypothetical protein